MNALTGERLSIITSKAQTTRHRIFGIVAGDDYQLVYSDTPGVLDPNYKLQEGMMRFVKASLEDADIVLFVVELGEKYDDTSFIKKVLSGSHHTILVINKIDLAQGSQLTDKIAYWKQMLPDIPIVGVSALAKMNLDQLFQDILAATPRHPAYFPMDALTDKSERFFAAEIVREKIFLNYKKEVPYSCEVVVTEFKEEKDIIRIRAEIFVERSSQKGILIGHQGASLKKVGMESRKDMETFFDKKVFLETYVKVEKDWRKNDKQLKRFGYL